MLSLVSRGYVILFYTHFFWHCRSNGNANAGMYVLSKALEIGQGRNLIRGSAKTAWRMTPNDSE